MLGRSKKPGDTTEDLKRKRRDLVKQEQIEARKVVQKRFLRDKRRTQRRKDTN